jgi:predicted AAA+ superfamily ATPase
VYNSAFRNRYGTYTFEEAMTDSTEWGRQVESAVGAHLANRSLLDGFELLYWRNDKKEECDYVLKKGQALVAIEVKSSSADDTDGYEKFKELYAEHITSAFIVGPEGLPLEDFFSIDLKTLFRKKR